MYGCLQFRYLINQQSRSKNDEREGKGASEKRASYYMKTSAPAPLIELMSKQFWEQKKNSSDKSGARQGEREEEPACNSGRDAVGRAISPLVAAWASKRLILQVHTTLTGRLTAKV